jgi:hypothetical protein
MKACRVFDRTLQAALRETIKIMPESHLNLAFSKSTVWMNDDFGVAVNPLVKLLIRFLRGVKPNLVAHDKARLRLASNDQIAKIAIVSFDIALAGAKRQTLQKC